MLKNKHFLMNVFFGVVVLTTILSGCSEQNNAIKQGAQAEQNVQAQQVAKITALEENYQRLEDMEQIKQLKARYFRFVDEKKWTEFGELFTSDAKIISEGQDYSKGGGPLTEK